MENEDGIYSICKQFGANVLFDQFSCTIELKDGKKVKYATDNQAKDVDQVLSNLDSLVKSGAHGRIFNNDNKFIGYAKGNNIEEVLVNVDMMIC